MLEQEKRQAVHVNGDERCVRMQRRRCEGVRLKDESGRSKGGLCEMLASDALGGQHLATGILRHGTRSHGEGLRARFMFKEARVGKSPGIDSILQGD